MISEKCVNATLFDVMLCRVRDSIGFGLCCLFSTLLRKGCHKKQEMSFGNEVTKTQTRYLSPSGDYALGLRASARFKNEEISIALFSVALRQSSLALHKIIADGQRHNDRRYSHQSMSGVFFNVQ